MVTCLPSHGMGLTRPWHSSEIWRWSLPCRSRRTCWRCRSRRARNRSAYCSRWPHQGMGSARDSDTGPTSRVAVAAVLHFVRNRIAPCGIQGVEECNAAGCHPDHSHRHAGWRGSKGGRERQGKRDLLCGDPVRVAVDRSIGRIAGCDRKDAGGVLERQPIARDAPLAVCRTACRKHGKCRVRPVRRRPAPRSCS